MVDLSVRKLILGFLEIFGLGHANGLLGLRLLDPGVELLDAAGEVGQVLDVVTVLGSLGLDLANELALDGDDLVHASHEALGNRETFV